MSEAVHSDDLHAPRWRLCMTASVCVRRGTECSGTEAASGRILNPCGGGGIMQTISEESNRISSCCPGGC